MLPRHRQRSAARGAVNAQRGFSLALVMLVILGGLLVSVAITSRIVVENHQNQEVSRRAQLARDAASIGSNRIIASLNRPVNRGLLTPKDPDTRAALEAASASRAALETDTTLQVCDRGPLQLGQPGEAFNAGAGARLDTPVSIGPAGPGASLRYSLTEIAYSSPLATMTPTPARGNLTLTVRGELVDDGGTRLSASSLRTTVAVIPKCCGDTFPDPWGQGSATCGAAGADAVARSVTAVERS